MGTGSFPGVKSGRGLTLTPHPLLVPRSWKGTAIPLLPLWAVRPVQSLSACTRVHFTLPYPVISFAGFRNHKRGLREDLQVQVRRASLFCCNKGQMMCMDTIPLLLTTVQVVRIISNKHGVSVHSVSHRLVTTEVRIRFYNSPHEICCGKSTTGTCPPTPSTDTNTPMIDTNHVSSDRRLCSN